MFRFRFLLSLFSSLLVAASGMAAYAQSTDSSNPAPLTDNAVMGSDDLRGQSYFYSFSAGPGEVSAALDCSADYYSPTLHVIFCDPSEVELANVALTASSAGSKKTARFFLPHKQLVRMQLMFPLSAGTHVKYAVHLSGPIVLAHKSGSAELVASDPATEKSSPPYTTDGAPIASAAKGTVATSIGHDDESRASSKEISHDSSPVEDKWALIVGISKFQKPGVNLKYSAKDATDLRDFLVKEENFSPDHVKLLVDEQATKENVLAELGDKWLPRLAHPNDLVLIFISTHGSPTQMDLEGLNYLVMYNTDPDSLYATGLPLQDLANTIKQRVHSNRVLLIVDACHSGAANPAKGISRVGNVDSDALLQGTGQLVICSSRPDQVSWESKRYPNGVFTRQLIESLRANSGKTTLGQAFDHMKESVESEVLQDRSQLQVPVLKSLWKGSSLILSAPPVKPRAVPAEFKGL